MEGILRYDQEKDSWFIEYNFKRVQVEPHSCPGKYPTDILLHDGTNTTFELNSLDIEGLGIEKVYAIIKNINN